MTEPGVGDYEPWTWELSERRLVSLGNREELSPSAFHEDWPIMDP